MSEYFSIYQYAFILCAVSGFTLSVQGAFMVARGESLQILALAQAALLGHLIGRLIFPEGIMGIFILSFFFLVLTKIFFLRDGLYYKPRESFFIAVYLVLMSLCFLLISLFPSLESHMTQGFFGDIVSLGKINTLICIILFCFFGYFLFFYRKVFIRITFEKAIMGSYDVHGKSEILFAMILILSLYNLGILFTLSAMILPVIVIGDLGKNLKLILVLMGIITAFSSAFGLALSIWFEQLSTVPTQILVLLVLSIMFRLFYCLGIRSPK